MRIGYSVEGSTDRSVIRGIRQQWCPDAELIEGRFRGTTHLSLHREYSKICDEFAFKEVDAMVFLTDANDRPWRQVQRDEQSKFPTERIHMAIHGVADRNIECWICAYPEYTAGALGIAPDELRTADPKGRFESALGIDRDDKQESKIAEIVSRAPLALWLRNHSFEDFYEQVRGLSQRLGCSIPNIRESIATRA